MQRRDFLLDVARLAAMCAVVPNDWRVIHRPRWADDPFTLGIASGDPTPHSVMLWTRLAPRPLEPDGGMPGARVTVSWEVAEDREFQHSVKKGRATAAPELGYSVHVDVDGLAPDRWYYYRFTTNDAASPVGRTRTAPDANARQKLRMGVVSCQNWEDGYYTAYGHLSREDVDIVTHLGDYIYEYGPRAGRPRLHASTEVRTLDQYRGRYAQYKTDALLQASHAAAPWVLTWDDHEVDNNYAGLVGENAMESEEQMRARRAAAYQAWWEHQPVRVPRAKSWADLNITRGFEWGALAKMWVLDSRQYRSDQTCGDVYNAKVPCAGWSDPQRTFLGAPQERWLDTGLAKSRAHWQVLANQTMLGEVDYLPGPDRGLSMDSWTGYPTARTRFLQTIARSALNRSVVLTGDNHANWVHDIRLPDAGGLPGKKFATVEFVGTSISSGGDGSDRSTYFPEAVFTENPGIKWENNRRGYMVCEVTEQAWRTEFRTVDFVSKPDAPVQTPTKWRVDHGRPGVERE